MAFVAGMVARAPRRRVSIPARLRAGGLPVAVCIRDISPRSMLIEGEVPPPTGTYVEIIGTEASVTGQVIWSKGGRFAVRTRERLNVKATADELRSLRLKADLPAVAPGAKVRPSLAGSASARQDQAERSRLLGRRIEHLAILICVAAGGIGIAGAVYFTMTRSFAAVAARAPLQD